MYDRHACMHVYNIDYLFSFFERACSANENESAHAHSLGQRNARTNVQHAYMDERSFSFFRWRGGGGQASDDFFATNIDIHYHHQRSEDKQLSYGGRSWLSSERDSPRLKKTRSGSVAYTYH